MLLRAQKNMVQFQPTAFSPKVRAWRKHGRALISCTSLFISSFLLEATAAELKFTSFKESSVLCSQVLPSFSCPFFSPACHHLVRSAGTGGRQAVCTCSFRAKWICKSSLPISDLQLWPWYFCTNVSGMFFRLTVINYPQSIRHLINQVCNVFCFNRQYGGNNRANKSYLMRIPHWYYSQVSIEA